MTVAPNREGKLSSLTFAVKKLYDVKGFVTGARNPRWKDTHPMARLDLRDELHRQVSDSIAQGAVAATGCKPVEREGFFYQPSILDHATANTRAYREELFGPVAIIIRAASEADALRIANKTRFGPGLSIWSKDTARAEQLATHIQAGSTFINGMVKSDPRLPFGGVNASATGASCQN